MTQLRRLSRIKDYRVFRDFRWPDDLHDFAAMNVIYGWNGSGKSSLSTLLTHVADRTPTDRAAVTYEFETGTVTSKQLPQAAVPAVRVFSQPFVARTIAAIDRGVDHIYYFGESSVEKLEQVEALKVELTEARDNVAKAGRKVTSADKTVLQFATDRAREIKELLLGSSAHANYNRRSFERAVDALATDDPSAQVLEAAERERLQRERHEQPRPAVPTVRVAPSDPEALTTRARALLARSVVSEALDELVEAPAVARWVEQGLALHAGAHHSEACRFCGGAIPSERRKALEGHFNDAFKRFTDELQGLQGEVERHDATFAQVSLPAGSALYEPLRADYAAAVETLREQIGALRQYLGWLARAVERKRQTPFQPVDLDDALGTQRPATDALAQAVDAVNDVLARHKARTDSLQERVTRACERLEKAAVAEALAGFQALRAAANTASAHLESIQGRPRQIEGQIAELERAIRDSRRPADELNTELANYLGRDELRFEDRDPGYVLLRAGRPVSHLSEGEKTAIALLYFLKSLEDRAFQREQSIVVIDDPVSSLDSNGLFNAFSFIKERTKDCGQLFVLTHNFAFFRLMKKWANHRNQGASKAEKRASRPHPPVGRFFHLRCARDAEGHRAAMLGAIDPLLHDYETEYHYLFRCVYREAQRTSEDSDLEALYGLPNIGRRLLEGFLSFKLPHLATEKQSLHAALEEMNVALPDPAVRTRLLQFLNTYSHNRRVNDGFFEPHRLAEVPGVMRDLLTLIEHADPDHFASLVRLVTADSGAAEGAA